MYTEQDVYTSFFNIKYQKSCNWENVKNKLSETNFNIVKELTRNFNTIWQDINVYEYMGVGTNLWKTFGPKYFLNKKLFKEYVRVDKSKKRNLNISNEEIEKSFIYIFHRYKTFEEYGSNKLKDISLPVFDYLKLKIDTITISYLMYRNLLKLSITDHYLIPYIIDRYDDIKKIIFEKENFLNDLENKYERKK